MEKKSVVIIAVFAVIIFAALTNEIGLVLTGKITQMHMPTITSENLEIQAAATFSQNMIKINNAFIEESVLEKIELLEAEDCQPIIMWYQPGAVADTIAKINNEKDNIVSSFDTNAIAPTIPYPLPALPFKLTELEAEIKEFSLKKTAIENLNKKTLEKFTENELSEVHTYKYIEGISGCLSKTGLDIAVNEPGIIVEDRQYRQTIHEAINLIEADTVWKKQATNKNIIGEGVNLAIIDSGIDYKHPDLGGCIGEGCRVTKGWNTLTHNQEVIDIDGHGTHLAGIAASVAPGANLIAIKACENGYCSASKIAEGIDWCIGNNCNIITLSLGDGGSHPPEECSKLQTLKPVLKTANDKGIAIFVSSGNDGKQWPAYPACDNQVTSVGSVNDFDDKISDFSNLHPDILAPGTPIESTWINNDYTIMQGTSQAAAFAAATAALYMQACAALEKNVPTPFLIEERFETNSKLIYDQVNDIEYPRINANILINSIFGKEPLPPYICNNSKCEFELGEDAQNCPQDCQIQENLTDIIFPNLKNYTLSLDIKNWQEALTPVRVEIRGKSKNKNFVKDFMYDYYTTEIELPEAVYDLKLSYGSFSVILRSINLNSSKNLDIKLEDLTMKIKELPEFPYAQIKSVYALGINENESAIVCFDKKLAGNSTFIFKCGWIGSCKENWNILTSMTQKETSCILLVPNTGTAFAIAEIPKSVCNNGICESGENENNCPEDCKFKKASIEMGKEKPIWLFILIFVIVIILAVIRVFFKKIKNKLKLMLKLKQIKQKKREKNIIFPPKPPKPNWTKH